MSWWISNSADRIMMNYYLTSEDLGIYGVAARIPSLLTTFTGIFNQAWVISAITSVGEVDRKKFYLKTYKEFMTIVFVISSLLIMFSRQVIILFTGPEFQAAWLYVPFLVTGVAISSLAGFFGTIYLAKKENNILMWTT
ncbi:TPA: lipopolysaccharide biosynthesis protein, partial [Streptococcus suis]